MRIFFEEGIFFDMTNMFIYSFSVFFFLVLLLKLGSLNNDEDDAKDDA